MDRYLTKSESEVYGIYEQELNRTVYIGQVIISKFGASVRKDKSLVYLSWKEMTDILELKPSA